MTIRFYSWPQSSGSGVHWALEELGLAYEYVRLDRTKGEHRSAEYLAINPNGKVPALVDGPECYFESLAILVHLAERYGTERRLWPASGNQRAEALSWRTRQERRWRRPRAIPESHTPGKPQARFRTPATQALDCCSECCWWLDRVDLRRNMRERRR